MKKLAKAVIAFLAAYVVVANMYVMATHADAVMAQAELDGYELPLTFTAPLYLGAAIGIAADVAFNLSGGTVIYLEPPREFTFTARSNRHLSSDGWRKEKAVYWCELLDRFQEGHCDDFAVINAQ